MARDDFIDKFSIRFFNLEKDYAMVHSWWKKHGSALMRPEYLPPTGIITEIQGEPAACGFLYRTDSRICVFEFVAVNPDVDRERRNLALDTLIEAALYWAKDNGFTLIYCSTSIPRFVERLSNKGFIKTDTNQNHMFCERL